MRPPEHDTLAGQALRQSVRAALRMPAALARRIFGEPPRNDRGAPLDFQTHLLLRIMEQAGAPDLHEVGPEEARQIYDRANRLFDLDPLSMHSVEDITIPGPAGDLPGRIYRPRKGALPGCVFFHGGGFVIGSHDSYEGFCSALAKGADCAVISVGYRLAPECPFPAAIADCRAGFEWVREQSRELGLMGEQIVVAGDSAGGNLATVVCQQQAEEGRPLPAHQLLIYPKTDYGDAFQSRKLFAQGFLLTQDMIDWFNHCYGADDDDPRCSPNRYDDLSILPPATVITAGFDPLRDEGETYAQRMAQAGVDVTYYCCDRLIHGFITQGGVVDAAAAAVADLAEEFGRCLRAEMPKRRESR